MIPSLILFILLALLGYFLSNKKTAVNDKYIEYCLDEINIIDAKIKEIEIACKKSNTENTKSLLNEWERLLIKRSEILKLALDEQKKP